MASSSDILFQKTDDQINLLNQKALNLDLQNPGIIEKIEFRTQTERWNLERQEYNLRVSFGQFGDNNILNEISKLQSEAIAFTNVQFNEEELYERYLELIDLIYFQEINFDIDEKLAFLKDLKLIVEDKIVNSTKLDLKDLINVHLDIKSAEIDNERNRISQNSSWSNLSLGGSKTILPTIKLEDLISVDEIRNNLDAWQFEIKENSEIYLERLKQTRRLLELDGETQSAKKLLDFIQLSHDGNDNLTFGNELSLGVGINIPFKKKNQRKINESLIDIAQSDAEVSQLEMKIQKEVLLLIQESTDLFYELDLYASLAEDKSLKQTLESLDQVYENNLEVNININLFENDIRLKTKLLKRKIRKLYIKFIYLNGYIRTEPDKNYLTEPINF